VVHPDLEPGEALAKLEEDLVFVLRLDEEDAAAAWRERGRQLQEAGRKLDELRFDALRFEGPGTDLTIGLLPSSRWICAAFETADGIPHAPNLPSEEVFTTPDPLRADGVVHSTKPLLIGGATIRGLTVRFEGGRAVEIDAEQGAETLREMTSHDDGGARLGELALVDREGRIGPLGTVFYDTLLDENAASHIALGRGFDFAVGEDDVARVNDSLIHIDFMIGGDDVDVTGLTADGERVPLLRGGAWQL
jgi:aminopeptidase